MGGMISTPAQLNQPSLLCNLMCKFIGFWGIRRRAYMSTRMHTTTYMDSPAYIVTYVMKHTRHICHATYTPTSTNKRIHARACVYKHTSRANISTRMHARQAFCKKRSRSDPFARSLSEPFARRLSDPLPLTNHLHSSTWRSPQNAVTLDPVFIPTVQHPN